MGRRGTFGHGCVRVHQLEHAVRIADRDQLLDAVVAASSISSPGAIDRVPAPAALADADSRLRPLHRCLPDRRTGPFPPVDVNISWSFYDYRFINAALALVMLLGMIFAATSEMLQPGIRTAVAAFLGMSVVLAQHRTVWAALIVATFLLLVRWVASGCGRFSRGASSGLRVHAFRRRSATRVLMVCTAQGRNRHLRQQRLPSPSGRPAPSVGGSRCGAVEWRRISSQHPSSGSFGGAFGQTPAWGPDSKVMVPVVKRTTCTWTSSRCSGWWGWPPSSSCCTRRMLHARHDYARP